MLRLEDMLPRKNVAEVLYFLFENPGATVRSYIKAKGIDVLKVPYGTVGSRFTLLVELGFAKRRLRGKEMHYTAVDREAFEDQFMQMLLERVFDESTDRFQVAFERLNGKRK